MYPELLSPVGDFDCLKAAVQNGANCVYLGASYFSARASATNFTLEELDKAVTYAKLRNVKVNLALNTLIKETEFDEALVLAKKAYELGVDALIIQDLGLANVIHKAIPDFPLHASTQMTIYNLDGVKKLEKLGYKRVVLARELSIEEIEYICQNSNIEIEVFVHGALCVSYSGQCLFSSMIGGRSGNRGKCAQPCRLPYTLIDENNSNLSNGYLLSPKDLLSIEYLPQLINAGVTCFKIEGRMKTPEYVATVTRIYRKYIDLAISNEKFEIDYRDKVDLLQVFNRGGSSSGYLESNANTNMIYKEKPNNMGIYLGKISHFNSNKGHIGLTLETDVAVGDRISINNNNYTISELMIENNNYPFLTSGNKVIIGRMKGELNIGDKIYKISSKDLTTSALQSFKEGVENKKTIINCDLTIKKNVPILAKFYSDDGIDFSLTSNCCLSKAINQPITLERIITQLSKTKSSIFSFEFKHIIMEDDVYIPNISELNEIRRSALHKLEELYTQRIHRSCKPIEFTQITKNNKDISTKTQKISLLLNIINLNYNYNNLNNVDKLYIPLKYFYNKEFNTILKEFCLNYPTYIYMPTIMKKNYNIEKALSEFNIKGFVVSHISQLDLLKDFNLDLIANYTFNIYNSFTMEELKILGMNTFTISPELDKDSILNLVSTTNYTEFIVYGKTPVMTTNYCVLGNSNKCYPQCNHLCTTNNKFYLKDRLDLKFRIIPNNIDTITTIYNSKVFSIKPKSFNVDFVRIDIIDETIDEINDVISKVYNNERFEGKDFTNNNLNREV